MQRHFFEKKYSFLGKEKASQSLYLWGFVRLFTMTLFIFLTTATWTIQISIYSIYSIYGIYSICLLYWTMQIWYLQYLWYLQYIQYLSSDDKRMTLSTFHLPIQLYYTPIITTNLQMSCFVLIYTFFLHINYILFFAFSQ